MGMTERKAKALRRKMRTRIKLGVADAEENKPKTRAERRALNYVRRRIAAQTGDLVARAEDAASVGSGSDAQ